MKKEKKILRKLLTDLQPWLEIKKQNHVFLPSFRDFDKEMLKDWGKRNEELEKEKPESIFWQKINPTQFQYIVRRTQTLWRDYKEILSCVPVSVVEKPKEATVKKVLETKNLFAA